MNDHVDPTSEAGRVPQPEMVPVLDVGLTVAEGGVEYPTAVIDAGAHPDVADLARVHAQEGMGDLRTEAMCVPFEDGHVFLLGVWMTSPVQAAFALAFSLPSHTEFLHHVIAAGNLLIATSDPGRAAEEKPAWLAIDLDPASLLRSMPDTSE